MTKNIIANGILKSILIITSILIGLFLLNEIKILISYIIIAAIVSLIGRPIVKFLMNKLKFKNSSASILTMALLVGLIIGVISLFIPLIIEQGKNLSLLDVDSFQENIKYLYIEMSNYLNQFNINLDKTIFNLDWLNNIDFTFITEILNSIGKTLGNLTIGILSVMFISFFFLKDSQMLQKILFILLPKKSSERIKNSYDKIKLLLSRYFAGLILQIFILFVIYIGTPNAVVIAFLCSLLNLIPFIGPFIGGILMVLLTMSSHISEDFSSVILPKATYVAIGFTFGQLIDNFLSQPFIFSNSVKSHPLEIFLVIIIAGLLFGPIGMIAAVPTYTALKVIGKEFLSENRIIKELTKNL
jgi:predicted PurR-regulated permease PerM